MQSYDLIVLGGGPGGYVAAIRAAQLGKKVAIVEREKLGGVCLNKGCIPTKALLKSAHIANELKHFKEFGIEIFSYQLDPLSALAHAEKIANKIGKGVSFLMNKNHIDVIYGKGKLITSHKISVNNQELEASNIIIATGAKIRSFPNLPFDGDSVINYWDALKLKEIPKKLAIIGGGAIGVEFAYFFNAFNTSVHIFERENQLLPMTDPESASVLMKSFTDSNIVVSLGTQNLKIEKNRDSIKISSNSEEFTFDKVLVAIGMEGDISDLGVNELNVKTRNGFIEVSEFQETSIENIYAIGDVTGPPLLAHVASHQGVIAVEKMFGSNPHPLNRARIPNCVYSYPQVASFGFTEAQLKDEGKTFKVGRFNFMNNGKAQTSEERIGFVKVLLGKYGEILGAHIVGAQASELIHQLLMCQTLEGVDQDIIDMIHAHPTMSEAIQEAVLNANNRTINV